MKELSIEEKAKRYDKAIEKAEKWHNAPNVDKIPTFGNRIIEDIFPELKESEDERIRKEILLFCQDRKAKYFNDPKYVNIDKWIAWLEKQGEQIDIANKEYWRGYREGKQEIFDKILDKYTELEKQGNNADKVKQQTIEIPFSAKDSELQEATYYIPDGYHAEINGNEVIIKQGEQKTIDKVEQIFEVGNWVVANETKYTFLVKRGAPRYQAEDTKGDIYSFYLLPNGEEEYHLWTIEDAKDGDVLVSDSNQPFIYNGKYTDSVVGAHIGINFDGEELFATKTNSWTMTKGVKPATKEQQDLLFQRMKKDGYEWDADTNLCLRCSLGNT